VILTIQSKSRWISSPRDGSSHSNNDLTSQSVSGPSGVGMSFNEQQGLLDRSNHSIPYFTRLHTHQEKSKRLKFSSALRCFTTVLAVSGSRPYCELQEALCRYGFRTRSPFLSKEPEYILVATARRFSISHSVFSVLHIYSPSSSLYFARSNFLA